MTFGESINTCFSKYAAFEGGPLDQSIGGSFFFSRITGNGHGQ